MASKRSFGTVEKLTSGRWRARYLGPDQTRHSAPVTFLARIDAEGWLVDEDRLIGRGEWTPPAERQIKTSTANVTVAEWIEQCIRDRASRTHKPIRSGTIDNYRKLARLAIVPGLGKIRVAVLSEPLRGWLHALPDRGRDQLIFPARDLVTPMADSTLRRSHDHGKAAVGRPALRVHDLRRTAATMAAQGGATVAELMNLLGHETATMAMRYQVASQERDRERVVRLSAAVLERVGGEDLYSI